MTTHTSKQPTVDASRPRRRLRFGLQSLFWGTLLVCVVLAWRRDRAQLQQTIDDLRKARAVWGEEEATGPPDTDGAGDIPTAWASQTPDGQREWLILDYYPSVIPTAIVIHETYNPGAVDRVSVFGPFNTETEVWSGTDPTPRTAARGVSVIPINTKIKTDRIKIDRDSPSVPGWNEIDAVGIQDASGRIYWASRARASSTYGRGSAQPSRRWMARLPRFP